MDSHYSLQVPNSGGPSRGISHPVSVQPAPSISQPQSAQKWASHNIQSSQQQPHQVLDNNFPYDAYSHPAAVAYAAAHPRRTIRKFGPYLVLQTLGEGESGKVKLGLHMKLGEEVAMKLIRKGNVDTPARISKVKREIEILKILKHPNVVRIYDVLETDKYIAIILEYASSGELFDHILAHRYLKEEDACKLFSQLISGVWYIHQKKIVHRDLTLENLLLDRHKNVMIVDFGFANRFEYRVDELMQTRCGSPCYAAPELVISDDMYVGPAMDIWSCGVILYAMLAGYLPFDDDPANPGEDDINLLYEYIVNTPLSFPDYISAEARDLLSIMLVPDPKKRADIQIVMNHRWLRPGVGLFNRTLGDLEHAAMEQHRRKRSAYQRQMKAAATAAENQRMATEPADPDRPDIREESLPGTESLMVSGIGAQQQQHERNLSPTTSLSQVLWNSESDIERHVNEMDDRLENHILSDRERQKLFNELCKICSRHRVIPKSMHIPDCSEGSVEIECGGSANVSQSTYKGYHVAVKAFRVYITSDLDVIFSRFCREGVAWKHLRHLNILPLLGVTISEHQLAMVSLWMENGNINQFIEKDRHTNRTMLLVDVASGLKYLHDLRIVHGDLKGANILINKDRRACIADFGLTTVTGAVTRVISGSSQASLISHESLMSFTTGGTYRWMSPELLDPERFGLLQSEDNRPTKQSDCYALGMVIYEVLCGYHPYVEIQSDILVVNAIMEGVRPEKPEGATRFGLSEKLWRILESCWLEDRSARPSVEDILPCLNDAAARWYTREF